MHFAILFSVYFLALLSGVLPPGEDPPPSFTEYLSACGSATVLDPSNEDAPGFPVLPEGMGDYEGELFVATIPPLGVPYCVCYFLEAIWTDNGLYVTNDNKSFECIKGCDSPPRECDPEVCLPMDPDFPKDDPDWADPDGDGIPNAYDLTDNGPDGGLSDGILPSGTNVAELLLIIGAEVLPDGYGVPDMYGIPGELVDANNDGVVSLIEGMKQAFPLLEGFKIQAKAVLAAQLEQGVPGAGQAFMDAMTKLSEAYTIMALGFLELGVPLSLGLEAWIEATLGGFIEKSADGESFSLGVGGTKYTFALVDNPDGSGGSTIKIVNAQGATVDVDEMPEGVAKNLGAFLTSATGDPVNTGNGEFMYSVDDYLAQGRGLPLKISRYYGSRSVHNGILGPGWSMPYAETRMVIWPGGKVLELHWGDGDVSVYIYDPITDFYEGAKGVFGKVTMRLDGTDPDNDGIPNVVARTPDGMEYHFCNVGWYYGVENGAVALLRKVTDPYGNALVLERDNVGKLVALTDTLGRRLDFEYLGGVLISIIDDEMRAITYSYNAKGELSRVQHSATTYQNDQGQLVTGNPGELYTYADHPQGFKGNESDARLNHNLESITTLGGTSPRILLGYYTDAGYSYDKVQFHDLGGDVTVFSYKAIGSGDDLIQMGLVDHLTQAIYPDGQVERFYHGDGLLLRHETLNGFRVSSGGGGWNIENPYINPDEAVTHWSWMEIMEYDEEYRLTSILETTDYYANNALGKPLGKIVGRRVEYVYDTSNPDRFQNNNIVEIIRRPLGTMDQAEQMSQTFVYDPITVRPIVSTDEIGRVSTRLYAHQEFGYNAAKNIPKVKGWGILPDVEPPHLAGIFGHGDLNGNGVLTNRFEPVVYRSPAVEVAAETGPDSPGSFKTPEQVIQWNDYGQPVASRDEAGGWDRFEYEGGMLVSQTEDYGGVGRKTKFDYDYRGQVTRMSRPGDVDMVHKLDSRGNVVRLVRTPASGFAKVDLSFGQNPIPRVVREHGYDLQGRLVSTSPRFAGGAAPNVLERFEYDSQDRMTARSRNVTVPGASGPPVGNWAYEYDGLGRLAAEVSPDGLRSEYTLDSRGLVLSVTNRGPQGEGLGTRFIHYDVFGNVTSLVDEMGRKETTEYDGYGRILNTVDSAGIVTTRNLDGAGRPILVEVRNANDVVISRETMEWDSADRLRVHAVDNYVAQEDGSYAVGEPAVLLTEYGYGLRSNDMHWLAVDSGGDLRLTRYERDSLGRLTGIYPGGGSDVGEQVTLSAWGDRTSYTLLLDSRGATGAISPSTATWKYNYDSLGWLSKVTTPSGVAHSYLNGPDGSPTLAKDPLGRVTKIVRDSAGKPIHVVRYGEPPAVAITESYGYDASGRLVSLSDGRGNTTGFLYDLKGMLRERKYSDGTKEVVARDKSGLTTRLDQPGGGVWTYSYLADGRLESLSAVGGNAAVDRSYLYDDRGNWLRIDEQVAGRPRVVLTRTADANGLSVEESSAIGIDPARTMGVRRHPNGVVTRMLYPSGNVVDRLHDPLGRLVQVSNTITGSVLGNSQPYGMHASREISLGGGATGFAEFDPDGRAVAWSVQSFAGQGLLGESYAYDGAGNLLERTQMFGALRMEVFEYDGFDRLAAWEFDVGGPGQRSVVWQWDEANNISSIADSSVSTDVSALSNSLNQLQFFVPDITAFSYEPNGGESEAIGSSGGRAWTYDALGRPFDLVDTTTGQAITLQFLHDGLDRMVRRQELSGNEVTHRYFGAMLYESQSSLSGHHEYVAGMDTTVPAYRIDNSQSGLHLAVDPSGNVRGLHNGTQLLESYDYDPFGLVRDAQTGDELGGSLYSNELFFLAAPTDLGLGLTRLGARFYDPALGRFLARDPIGEAGGLNIYSYANANPLRWEDPTGLAPDEISTGPQGAQPDTSTGLLDGRSGDSVYYGDSPLAIMDDLIDGAGGALSDSVSFDGFLATAIGDLGAAEEVLELFIEGTGGETNESVLNTIEWANEGLTAIDGILKAEYALDLPTNLLTDGLKAVGVEEMTASLAANGVMILATGGGMFVAKKALKKGWRYAFKKAAKSALKGGCFVAGTAVLVGSPSVAHPDEGIPIEEVALGTLVSSEESPHLRLVQDDVQLANFGLGDLGVEAKLDHWRRIDLVMPNGDQGEEAHISLLRPDGWLQEQGGFETGAFQLVLPEQGLVGPARVINDQPYAGTLDLGDCNRRPVTGLFTRTAHELILIDLVGAEEDLEVTPFHPIFSADRCDWIPANQIKAGERLTSAAGAVQVEGVRRVQGTWEVHNLEVLVGATYRVGALGVLVHNDCDGVLKKAAKGGARFSKEKQALVDMAKRDKKTGMTSGDMQAYKDLNKGLPDPFPANKVRGPEVHPPRTPNSPPGPGQQPHGHVGPVNHIPIRGG